VSATLNELADENRALKHVLQENARALAERDTLLSQRLQRIVELEHQIATLITELRGSARDQKLLEARLQDLLAKRRALAECVSQGQLSLGFELTPLPTPPCVNEAPDGETAADCIRPRHQRRNAPRELAYAALPREHVHHELPELERVCPVTQKELVFVGEKQSEVLEYSPARLIVIVHHRHVYGLRAEDQAERKAEPIVAPAPVQPLEDVRVGAGLLAWIVVQKYANHLPLYRQQAIFGREGLALPRQTMCDWVMASAHQLEPIQRALKERILASGVVQLDDTPVKCQGRSGGELFEARLWTFVESTGLGRRIRLHVGPHARARARFPGRGHRGLPRRRWLRGLRHDRGQTAKRDSDRLLGARAAEVPRRAQGFTRASVADDVADRGAVRRGDRSDREQARSRQRAGTA